jgi:hypothetical protein
LLESVEWVALHRVGAFRLVQGQTVFFEAMAATVDAAVMDL